MPRPPGRPGPGTECRRLLPQEFEPELQLARIVRRRDGAEAARAPVAVWCAEVRSIQQIECLETELELRRPAEREPLGCRENELPEIWSADRVPLSVAEGLAR